MMATPKTRTTKPSSAKPRAPKSNADDNLLSRTGRTVKQKPYVSAAIATGAVTAVAAVAAGAYFFARKDKSFGDLSTRVKDGFAEVSEKVRDRFAKPRTQSEIAEEALTLKETGKHDDLPIANEIKVTAVTH